MKKLFLFSVAALAFCACSSDEVVSENNAANQQPKEISFSPLAKPNTRAAVLDGTFPTSSNIQVAAYDAGNGKNYFDAANFVYSTSTLWHGESAKYWPLSPATINFLGYANLTGETAAWASSGNAAGVTLTMADNSSAQNDLMYAVGQGKVTQTGNALKIPDAVDMVFKHAQALLTFNVKANSASTITLKKITLNNAIFSGSLALTTDCKTATAAAPTVTAVWTPGSSTATFDAFSGSYPVTTSSVKQADIMVVPHPTATSFDSFTLTYAIGGNDYEYTFTPVDRNLAKATKYVYDITFTVHEIFINASVDTWTETTSVNVEVPTKVFTYVASTGVTGDYNMLSATAGTYTVSIKGLPADNYKAEIGTTGTGSFITAVSPSTDTAVAEGDAFIVSFTVSADAGKNQTVLIKNDEGTTLFTLTVIQP